MIVSLIIKENCININKLHNGSYLYICAWQHLTHARLSLKTDAALTVTKKWGYHWPAFLHFTSQTSKYFMHLWVEEKFSLSLKE